MTISEPAVTQPRPKPFLRWAGGKIWLTRQLTPLLPKDGFNNYHEPFLGGGSVYLAVDPQGKSFLSDLNQELIDTYTSVRDILPKVIEALQRHENTSEYYYKLRSQRPTDAAERAARFIYLNQTSFNGIYRVNLNGHYNVPYGHRSKDFLDTENLELVSEKLQTCQLGCYDFGQVIHNVRAGDLVFLDPPYTVSHNKNGFIKYNQQLFSLDDQKRLRNIVDALNERGAYYILTNAAHATIAEIFSNGDVHREMTRTNVIGGKQAARGKTSEYLFTNIGAT